MFSSVAARPVQVISPGCADQYIMTTRNHYKTIQLFNETVINNLSDVSSTAVRHRLPHRIPKAGIRVPNQSRRGWPVTPTFGSDGRLAPG